MADEQLPRKGYAAPLHGMQDPAARLLIGVAFMSMGLVMCNHLALTAGMSLTSPLLKAQLANLKFGNNLTAAPAIAPMRPVIAPMSIKPPSPVM